MSASIVKRSANLLKNSKQIINNANAAKDKKLENELETIKKMAKFKFDIEYQSNFRTNFQYEEKELFIFNHKGWITGYFDNDTSSSDLVLMRCGQKKPKGILLGDCNMSDFEFYEKGEQKYRETPTINPISGEDLLGRQRCMKFFRENFPKNLKYVKDTGDYKISQIDTQFKRKVFNCNLTLSHYGCFFDSIKIIFASPNKLLHFEDLVVNFSLEELQYMFVQTIQEYKNRASQHLLNPPLIPPEMYERIHEITQEIHGEKLFEKKCLYTAAVFRKIHKLYPENILFMPNYLVQRTYENM